MKFRVFLRKNTGVTLIELLIALVISAILIAAIYRTFIGQQKTYIVQEQVVDMQQNVRVAINRMMREIRMAGFGNIETILPVKFTVHGEERTFSDIINPNKPDEGAITIVEAIDRGVYIESIPEDNKITLNEIGNLNLFDNGNKKYISIGGIESHVITDVSGNTITLSKSLNFNHPNKTPVFPIRAITYQVVYEDDKYILKRDENIGGGKQPLAENIENIQFEFFDVNGNPTTNPKNIHMVRVSVTARTERSDPDFKEGEGYRRRTIASNIHIRNMGVYQ